ncbi:hypothetical protein N7494_005348 [Penicillium frequentans]|uniref:Uncharacterized protein n=1 Tax=Penicillium frequentans TaxID=3151616 RepID=A0AAD6GGY1_9EURO|nr:hypothetical protein N7494_005348 [Penicillium glabrum]
MADTGHLHDTSEKPGSASNPIVIDVEENRGNQHTPEHDDSDGDTVRLSTPEFWAIVGDVGPPRYTSYTRIHEFTFCFDVVQSYRWSK